MPPRRRIWSTTPARQAKANWTSQKCPRFSASKSTRRNQCHCRPGHRFQGGRAMPPRRVRPLARRNRPPREKGGNQRPGRKLRKPRSSRKDGGGDRNGTGRTIDLAGNWAALPRSCFLQMDETVRGEVKHTPNRDDIAGLVIDEVDRVGKQEPGLAAADGPSGRHA